MENDALQESTPTGKTNLFGNDQRRASYKVTSKAERAETPTPTKKEVFWAILFCSQIHSLHRSSLNKKKKRSLHKN